MVGGLHPNLIFWTQVYLDGESMGDGGLAWMQPGSSPPMHIQTSPAACATSPSLLVPPEVLHTASIHVQWG